MHAPAHHHQSLDSTVIRNADSSAPISFDHLAAPTRLASLDAARVFATFGIIWVHVAEGQGQSEATSSWGRFGTSFYIIVAVLFAVRAIIRAPDQKFSVKLWQRTQRILQPFVIWSLVYGICYGTRTYLQGGSWAGLSMWWGPVAGTAVHLWFLPFVFVWGVFAIWTVPYLLRMNRHLLLVAGVLTSGTLYYYCYRVLFFTLDRPWLWSWHLHRLDRWIVEVPLFVTALLGVVYFYRLKKSTHEFLKSNKSRIATFSLIGFILVEFSYAVFNKKIVDWSGTEGRFVANLAGIFLLFYVSAINRSWLVQRLAPYGRYTYVAFLSHMLVLELLRTLTKNWPGDASLLFSFVGAVSVLILSMLLSRRIAETRMLSWLRA